MREWGVILKYELYPTRKYLWCNSNLKGTEWDYWGRDNTFYFKNPEDATAFKLRWPR